MGTATDPLKKMTAWDVEPALSEDDLDELLERSSMMDGDENTPSSVGWSPTYNLNSAAAAGWMIKAGRASGLVEVDPPGSGSSHRRSSTTAVQWPVITPRGSQPRSRSEPTPINIYAFAYI